MAFRYLFAAGLLALGCPLLAQAQQAGAAPAAAPAGTGSLSGTVLDSLKHEPVPYATVALLPPAPNDAPITGVAADEKGRFTLVKLTPGPARLRVSYVGYGVRTRAVTITAGATALGSIQLAAAGTALGEAVVVGTRPVVEVRPDRLVYNADQDVTNAGGTAADVLRKAPLLSVDNDGNVRMRGSGNFKVLVNNKPSPTFASNIAEALKGIPADQIKSVELITSPPAKYEGEGTAGIINIILKKGIESGLNGRVGATLGNRNSGLNASLNFRKKKLNFTSSLSGGTNYGPNESLLDRTGFVATGTTHLLQTSTGSYQGGYGYATAGADYDLSEHQSVSLAGSFNFYKGLNSNALLNRYTAPNSADNLLFVRDTDSQYQGLNGELTGTYTRTFKDKPRKEWSVLGQVARNVGQNRYDLSQYLGEAIEGTPSYQERSLNRTPRWEYTAQADLVQPLGEKRTLEAGLKGIWRRTGSVATVDGYTPGRTPGFVSLPGRNTDFDYDQDVQAAYATYAFSVGKKLSLSAGSRLERTQFAGDVHTTNTSFGRSYLSLLPSGFAQYTLGEASSARVAYSRRITRPYIYYLNPFVNRSDSLNIYYGNPELDPELTDSYELSMNTAGKLGSLNISGSVRRTGNAIEQIVLPTTEQGVTARTYRNVASNVFYQLNLYGSIKPAKGWDVSGGPDVQYIVRRSPTLNLESRGVSASLNLNTSYKLGKTYTLQAFFYGSLPGPELQGRGLGYVYHSVGVKKVLMKEKADLTLNLGNPFMRYNTFGSTTSTTFLEERQEYRSFQRSVRLSFAYRFGQSTGGKQRKQVSNNDTKGGGGQQGGQ